MLESNRVVQLIKGGAKMEKALIIPDIHAPLEHKPTIKIAIKLARDLKPDYIVYLGDCFDATGISRWRDKRVTEEDGVWATGQEIEYFKKNIYDPLKKASGKRVKILWCGGNHDEERTRLAIADTPDRKKILDIRKIFPDAKICEYGEYHKIGKLVFTHGDYHNDAHAKKHVLTYGSSVCYGHTHNIQSYTMIAKADKNPHKAQSMGCACNKNPEYIRSKSNAWQHALGVAYFQPNGNYNLYTVEVIRGEAMFNGKTYKQ